MTKMFMIVTAFIILGVGTYSIGYEMGYQKGGQKGAGMAFDTIKVILDKQCKSPKTTTKLVFTEDPEMDTIVYYISKKTVQVK